MYIHTIAQFSLTSYRYKGEGARTKTIAMKWIKNAQKNHVSNPHTQWVGIKFQIFRNCMICADLYRKIMFLTLYAHGMGMGWVIVPNIVLLGIA